MSEIFIPKKHPAVVNKATMKLTAAWILTVFLIFCLTKVLRIKRLTISLFKLGQNGFYAIHNTPKSLKQNIYFVHRLRDKKWAFKKLGLKALKTIFCRFKTNHLFMNDLCFRRITR